MFELSIRQLLYIIFLALLPFTPIAADQQSCPGTDHCKCTQIHDHKNQYSCSGNIASVDIELYNNSITLKCKDFVHSRSPEEYLKYFKEIEIKSTTEKFTFEQCPIPDKPFVDLLTSIGIHSIKEIFFMSDLNMTDSFEENNFKNLPSLTCLHIHASIGNLSFKNTPNLETLSLIKNSLAGLPLDVFSPLSNLKILHLGNNNLSSLDENIFRNNTNLRELHIEKNALQGLPSSLLSLENLTVLDLSDNRISSLDNKVFDKLHSLEKLNLNNNHLDDLPKGIFVNNSKLKNIKLVNAFRRENLTLQSGLFANSTDLEGIILDNNNITSLPEDLFPNCFHFFKLFRFSCKGNLLKTLPSNIFQSAVDLMFLDLSRNKLEYLSDGLFDSLRKLVKLNLAENCLKTIESTAFENLENLMFLDLSKNHLKNFQENAFQKLENIVLIDLSDNQLAMNRNHENISPFKSCSNLETLDLRNNSLIEVFFSWDQFSPRLRSLDLSLNNLTSISFEDSFLMPQRNQTINVDLSNNKIEKIDSEKLQKHIEKWCTDPEHKCNETINSNRGIVRFNLGSNLINCDCHIFYIINHMHQEAPYSDIKFDEVLCQAPESLKGKPIRQVHQNTLECSLDDINSTENQKCPKECTCRYRTDKCVIVDCAGKGIHKFPKEIPKLDDSNIELWFDKNNLNNLDGLSNLLSNRVIKLSLSNNKLKGIDNLKIPNTLKILELDNNQITAMGNDLIDQIKTSKSLTNISLHNNPWTCDCPSSNFIHLVKLLSSDKKLKDPIKDINCAENHESIIDVELEHCHNDTNSTLLVIILIVILTVIGIFVCVVIISYFIFRYEIKVWMFTNNMCPRFVLKPDTDTHKIYDVYFSVSNKDEAFAINQLVPQLENNMDNHYKLYIQCRDYISGGWIANQIRDAVRNSSRTIIVLSVNYLNNEWAREEFRNSHLNAIKDYNPRVIIILLDDIDTKDVDPELKILLTKNKILKRSESLFWEKLKYELPHIPIIERGKSNAVELRVRKYRQ